MALSTANSAARPRFGARAPFRARSAALLAVACFCCSSAFSQTNDPASSSPALRAQKAYREARERYQSEPQSGEAAWQFSRACFDLADFAATKSDRARIAREGIGAGERALAIDPNSAAGHYYVGMNLGKLAQTKGLGALKLVGQMRDQFERAERLDEHFDYAGPARNLGLLYRDTPRFFSIGDRKKAAGYLEQAVALAPEYPENRLNLIESLLKWGDTEAARTQFDALNKLLPKAHARFSGPEWAGSWADWDTRIAKIKRKL